MYIFPFVLHFLNLLYLQFFQFVKFIWHRLCNSPVFASQFPFTYSAIGDRHFSLFGSSSLFSTKKIVGNDKYSESVSMNIPRGLFPSPGAKLIILSTPLIISCGCSKVSNEPEKRFQLHTSYQKVPNRFGGMRDLAFFSR